MLPKSNDDGESLHQLSSMTVDDQEDTSNQSSRHQQQEVTSSIVCWLQVVGVFAIWTNSWGLSNTFGVFQTYYQSSEGFPRRNAGEISWIGSLQPFLLLFVGALSGPLYDAGHCRTLIVIGNLLVVAGLMITSLCKEYWQALLAQGVTCGIGYGLLFTPGVSILPQYFTKRRVLAGGIASAGSGFGGLIYSIIFRRLQPTLGFPWTVRVIAFLSLLFGIIAVATLKDKTKPRQTRTLPDFHSFAEPAFLFNTLGLFFALGGLYVPYYYVTTYALEQGHVDANLASYLVPIMNAGSIAGRIIPNFLADTVGPFNMLVPCTGMAGVLCLAWIGIRHEPGLIIFAILYGFFSGTFLSLPPTAVAALTKDMSRLGSRTGACFGVACFGVLVGTPICGTILSSTKSFVGLQIFGGCFVLTATVFVALARISKSGIQAVKV